MQYLSLYIIRYAYFQSITLTDTNLHTEIEQNSNRPWEVGESTLTPPTHYREQHVHTPTYNT